MLRALVLLMKGLSVAIWRLTATLQTRSRLPLAPVFIPSLGTPLGPTISPLPVLVQAAHPLLGMLGSVTFIIGCRPMATKQTWAVAVTNMAVIFLGMKA